MAPVTRGPSCSSGGEAHRQRADISEPVVGLEGRSVRTRPSDARRRMQLAVVRHVVAHRRRAVAGERVRDEPLARLTVKRERIVTIGRGCRRRDRGIHVSGRRRPHREGARREGRREAAWRGDADDEVRRTAADGQPAREKRPGAHREREPRGNRAREHYPLVGPRRPSQDHPSGPSRPQPPAGIVCLWHQQARPSRPHPRSQPPTRILKSARRG
jgi:hypothetical protein